MKLLDLFSGLGMFSFAARNVFKEKFESAGFVEIDPYCQNQILELFPDAEIHDNIKTYTKIVKADIITAGFPCTDLSIATPVKFKNKQERIDGNRSGLWREIIRISGAIRPKFIVLENSPNIVYSNGISSIIAELTEMRYCLWWSCLSAQDFGFPHRRQRWYAIAFDTDLFRFDEIQIFSTLFSQIFQETKKKAFKKLESKFSRSLSGRVFSENYAEFLSLDNGYSQKENQDDLHAIGNSIVPEIAEHLFLSLQQFIEKTQCNQYNSTSL